MWIIVLVPRNSRVVLHPAEKNQQQADILCPTSHIKTLKTCRLVQWIIHGGFVARAHYKLCFGWKYIFANIMNRKDLKPQRVISCHGGSAASAKHLNTLILWKLRPPLLSLFSSPVPSLPLYFILFFLSICIHLSLLSAVTFPSSCWVYSLC